ncbi:uncharacterized protein FIBRA_06116 [Fibroporia radiculosa]|uniref:Uncharacterized protein n=1 Tax=Fibroporia radiculosa TaxID=599839 RepID=J4IB33_9APHY|nr:uncharacterized protein FIBRA_06116 [Fibroporia radiculosa]CCM03961.1 predicted protein [Fibroporia radiculosa]
MLRQGLPTNPMLNMPGQHFLPSQQGHGQPAQGPPPQPAMFQNGQTSNAPMSLLGAGQNLNTGPNPEFYQLHLQRTNQSNRQQVLMQQAHSMQHTNPQRPAGPPVVNGLNHSQLPGTAFPNGLIPQQQIRRPPAQPGSLNQPQGHMGPIPQTMGALGGMPMNSAQAMPAHMRPVHQPQHHMNGMRLQSQQHLMQGHMSPEGPMGMSRAPPHLQVNNALPPHANRTPSSQQQMIGNIPQPSSLTAPHPDSMQPQMSQSAFTASMSMPHHAQLQQMGSSPHVGSHPQAHTPVNLAQSIPPSNVGPQTPGSRSRLTPDNAMFMNFQNPPMQPSMPQMPRLPPTTSQFPFTSTSTSPHPPGDIPQNVGGGGGGGGGQLNAPGPSSRPNPLTTPAQLYESLNTSNESFHTNDFNVPPQHQQNVPPRPPSHNASHSAFPLPPQQQGLQRHQSPRPADHMNPHVQRPQSGQGQQRPSPQQQHQQQQPGPSRTTPRTAQQPLPGNIPPTARIPQPGPPHTSPRQQQQQPAPGPLMQMPPRPPPMPQPAAPAPSNGSAPAHGQPENPPPPAPRPTQQPMPVMRSNAAAPSPWVVGLGQATMRLLQMSGELQSEQKGEHRNKHLGYWNMFVNDYFTHSATMKFTLWKGQHPGDQKEAKPFEIGTHILPRFFLVTTQSGVKSMSLSLDGAREKLAGLIPAAVVECAHAMWTFRYTNGYTVVLKGPLTAHILAIPIPANPTHQPPIPASYQLRIETLTFDATSFEKSLNIDSIAGIRSQGSPSQASINLMGQVQIKREDDDKRYDEPRTIIDRAVLPGEPINAFGIPQATMRCLELAESVAQMSDLIQFSLDSNLGPIDALDQYAKKLREQQARDPKAGGGHKPSQAGLGGFSTTMFDGTNGVMSTPSVSLFNNISGGSQSQPPAPSTPQNPPACVDAKQNKVPPAPASQASTATMSSTTPSASASTPAAAVTPGGPSTTPSMPNATLKRKAQRNEDGSPTVANADQTQPNKRQARKRGRT